VFSSLSQLYNHIGLFVQENAFITEHHHHSCHLISLSGITKSSLSSHTASGRRSQQSLPLSKRRCSQWFYFFSPLFTQGHGLAWETENNMKGNLNIYMDWTSQQGKGQRFITGWEQNSSAGSWDGSGARWVVGVVGCIIIIIQSIVIMFQLQLKLSYTFCVCDIGAWLCFTLLA